MTDDLPFSGLKVLDATQGVAGPHAGLLLAQHGADVIKLEPPEGDWGRALGRRYGDLSAYALIYNRGKRSIALDLKNADGRAVAQRLAGEADVVLESFRPGVMARFGLDYDSVRKANPNVVYLSVTGYGQTGPYAKQPVTDSIMQAYSGLMSINRDGQGLPQRIGIIAIDIITGLYAFQAISAALYKRAMKGGGAYIDASLMQAAVAFQAPKMVEHALEGAETQALGAPLGTMKTRDGYININARRQAHYAAFCRILDLEALIEDPRFATPEARVANERELMPLIRAAVAERDTAALATALTEADVLNAPVSTYDDLFADAHAKAVGALTWMDYPGMGTIPVPKIPGVPLAVPGEALAECPRIGQHGREILASLGFGVAEIDRLAESAAVQLTDVTAGGR